MITQCGSLPAHWMLLIGIMYECTPILNKIPRMTALCQGILTTGQCMLAYYHPNMDGLFPMGEGAYGCRLIVVTFAGPSENRKHKS